MQNLVATKPGIQRITGITVFDTKEMKSYEPLPDLEVSYTNWMFLEQLDFPHDQFLQIWCGAFPLPFKPQKLDNILVSRELLQIFVDIN